MASLSVGQVSALIAAGTAIVQLLLPLVIPLILIAYINKKNERVTASAATWSTLNRALHRSWWPTILHSDTAATKHVALCVSVATYFGIFAAALVAIAAVITPLGLYDAISTGNRDSVAFSYARDPSPFGYGTPPRSELGFSRLCEGIGLVLCPGTNFTLVPGQRPAIQMYAPDGYNTSMPREYQDIWGSGLVKLPTTVSSIFDIQYRSPVTLQQDAALEKTANQAGVQFNNGSAYLAGGYRNLYTVLLRNSTEAYEGLIVDTINGGVGFRNHTVPPVSTYGSTWTEDILFIQPETRCVDTNLTIDFTLTQNNASGEISAGRQVWLTDKGGFSSLESDYDWQSIRNDQDNARLYDRAYTAAWMNNLLSMMYLNETNADAGQAGIKRRPTRQTFRLQDANGSTLNPSISLTLSGQLTGKYDKLSTSRFGAYLPVPNSDLAMNSSSTSKLYPNPQGINDLQFQYAAHACRGYVNATVIANISNLAVQCGLMYAPPRLPSQDLNVFDRGRAGQNLTQSMYSCASASKATIKTVTFKYNGTGGFEGLQVLSINDKRYASASDKPLWGVENSGMNYSAVSPLWGFVDSKYREDPRVSTIQSDSLWLPGFPEGSLTSPVNRWMNTPGAHFYSVAMSYVYEKIGSTVTTPNIDVLGYSGHAQFAMYRRWLELSANAQDAGKIINLVWTDIVANSVVGTKGWAAEGMNGNAVEVTYDQRRVQYHLVYAIPAFILLAMTLCLLLLATILAIMQRTGLQRMRWFLGQTSLGRNFTALLYSDVSSQETSSKAWQDHDGQRLVTVTASRPFAGGVSGESDEPLSKPTERPEEEVESSQRFLTK